jgi:hypothetical protein
MVVLLGGSELAIRYKLDVGGKSYDSKTGKETQDPATPRPSRS